VNLTDSEEKKAGSPSPISSGNRSKVLFVSIHDVSPLSWANVRSILGALEEIGVRHRILLVVPDHWGKGRIDEAPQDFQNWLRSLVENDELCLHGWRHRTDRLPDSWLQRVIATCYTNREGEFFHLDQAEAAHRIRKGLEVFRALGLPRPEGFVAPAWLLSEDAEEALKTEGFTYTTRLGSMDILAKSLGPYRARTLCYSVRSGWRRGVSRLYNPILAWGERQSRLFRVSIHPVDFDYPAIFRQTLKLIEKAAAQRRISTYREFVRDEIGRMIQKQE
jgi:uncharacterized protein